MNNSFIITETMIKNSINSLKSAEHILNILVNNYCEEINLINHVFYENYLDMAESNLNKLESIYKKNIEKLSKMVLKVDRDEKIEKLLVHICYSSLRALIDFRTK